MGDEWQQGPGASGWPGQDDLDKRLEDIRRKVIEGTSEAQQRIKRVVDRAGEYWQQTNTPLQPRQSTSAEEERIRRLANQWSLGNWQIARELGTYMDLVSWSNDEVWEVTVQTRRETRAMEVVSEPYTGWPVGTAKPLLPVWDYDLPPVTGLKAPETRTRIEGLDEVFACTACNSTGRLLCTNCSGKGWVICPDCKGRTRIRCSTCRGRGYVADWQDTKKKTFFQKRAEGVFNSVGDKVSDIFEGIRETGVPISNPLDSDPASKGRTIPCPDCVNGEVECTCGTGKRVCSACQGSKTELCSYCGGTGKVVRHREIVRRFDLISQGQFVGPTPIPEAKLAQAEGEIVYSAEVREALYPDAPPENVPLDVWRVAVQLAENSGVKSDSVNNPREQSRVTLQVIELVRIPYTKVDYRYANQDYTFYIYDVEGQEKFYSDRYPARWDRIERLFRSITNDLFTPAPESASASGIGDQVRGYRVPVEKPPYSITEEEDEEQQ
ncbi:MAG TPA: hypothetical protein VFA41_02010 [Ktedonobacteraceae bacterium]|jgi:hypothetical protein|nr:hypothetical protein [Ktedonobacteraceae bacterium]